jgi:hypothetical protein
MMAQNKATFAGKNIIPVGILAALLYAIGGPWDQMIHVRQGHTLLATPHLIIGGGLSLYIFSGILALFILRDPRISYGERNALKLIMLGAAALPIGLIIDELWHKIFGVDMTAWSPPHVAIFFGMVSALLGLALLEANRKERSGWFSWSSMRLIFFFASIFFVVLFFFIDFDVPGMAYITQTRPEFSYVGALTGVLTFLFLLTLASTRRPGAATLATLVAWGYYTGMGLALGVIDFRGVDPHRILPPFPIVVTAIMFDLFTFALLGKRGLPPLFNARFLYGLLIMAITIAPVCYFSIFIWAELYTELPQQLMERGEHWLVWLLATPAIALVSSLAAFLTASWAMRDNKHATTR